MWGWEQVVTASISKAVTPWLFQLIRSWLEKPLLDITEIGRRQVAVEELVEATIARGELIDALKDISDFERVQTRIVTGTVNCRDLLGLARGFRALPELKRLL